MQKTLLWICCVSLILTTNALAQNSSYEEGYIVTQNRDTVFGFIDRSEEVKLSRSVRFKADLSLTNSEQYGPEDIFGFSFKKDALEFESVPVELRKSREVLKVSRFAKRILTGYVSLYKLQVPLDERDVIFFKNNTFVYVIKKENGFLTLGQYEYERDNKVGLNKQYIGGLEAAFSDCPGVLNGINKLPFDDNSIAGVVKKYNRCKRPEKESIDHAYRVKPVVAHGIEISYATITAPNDNWLKRSRGYSAGYFWDILKPDISKKHSSRLGINYLYLTYDEDIPNTPVGHVVTHSLRFPLTAQFNLNRASNSIAHPFFNFGLTGEFSTDEAFRYLSVIPFIHLAIGTYLNNVRISVIAEKDDFSIKSPQIISFTVGVRLDKN